MAKESNSMSVLLPLGVNGFFPSFGRQTASFVLVLDGHLLLLDAGSGVSRLFEPELRALVDPFEEIHILLSHYHIDHVVGLAFLPGLIPNKRVTIYGPADPMIPGGPAEALDRLLTPPLHPLTLETWPMKAKLVAVRGPFQIGALRVDVWRQRHPGGSIGYRVGDSLAYITDTTVNVEIAERLKGLTLLLHELWLTDREALSAPEVHTSHSNLGGVAEITARAGVDAVMPIHHQPRRTASRIAQLTAALAKASGVRAVEPIERLAIDLNSI